MIAKPQVYWILVTKLKGGVNFQSQDRNGNENCCLRTLSIRLKLRICITGMQAFSKLDD